MSCEPQSIAEALGQIRGKHEDLVDRVKNATLGLEPTPQMLLKAIEQVCCYVEENEASELRKLLDYEATSDHVFHAAVLIERHVAPLIGKATVPDAVMDAIQEIVITGFEAAKEDFAKHPPERDTDYHISYAYMAIDQWLHATSFDRRRKATREKVRQLQADIDSYNQNHLPPGEKPIEMSFDFDEADDE